MVHTRSRTGCLTCRDDGYKCDEAKPECGRCTRLGKTCKGYGLRVRWKTMDSSTPPSKVAKKRSSRSSKTASQQTSSSSISSPTSTRTNMMAAAAEVTAAPPQPPAGPISGTTADLVRNPSYVSPDVSPTTRFLLHHWTSSLASVLSVAAGVVRNPFLEHLTPMMMRSDALLHAVASMAAGHLGVVLRSSSSSSSSNDDAALQGLAARHMLAAVSSLRASIQTADAQVSLATILMLQLSDRLLDTDSRIDHLAGARAVIARSGGPAGGVWATGCSRARFLLSLCFHHDVMSSVSRGARPLLSMADAAAPPPPPPLEGLDSLGKLTALVSVVGAISTMQGRSGEAHRQRGWRIKAELSGVEVDPAGEADVENTIQAYRHAAMVYLYRVWDEGTPPPPPKAYHAGRCVDYLLRVPVTSSFVSAHAWPLWTGGCESVDARPRQLVRQRLQQMYEHRHLPSLRRVQQDMEDVWRAKDSQRLRYGTENVDCCKVILYSRKREADLV
ncbi:putative transcriptional regulatory protein [Colletotrichum spinosum]|uniref:Putative transcriptional regulatory protein n=1 Tax=Colletotrichum spinosum TaxID=1347390 RepID=A0A4R8PX54_9PEZI|nr:putative transcriptional regulatory protein [Colletotrichum spinosum]